MSFCDEFIESIKKLEQNNTDENDLRYRVEVWNPVHDAEAISRLSSLKASIEEIGAKLIPETAFYGKNGLASPAQWLALQVRLSSVPAESVQREAYKRDLEKLNRLDKSSENERRASGLEFQIECLKSARSKVTARQFIRTFLQAFEITGNRRPKNRITAEIINAALGNNSIDSKYGITDEYVKGVVKELVKKGVLKRANVKSTPRK